MIIMICLLKRDIFMFGVTNVKSQIFMIFTFGIKAHYVNIPLVWRGYAEIFILRKKYSTRRQPSGIFFSKDEYFKYPLHIMEYLLYHSESHINLTKTSQVKLIQNALKKQCHGNKLPAHLWVAESRPCRRYSQ